MLVLLCITLAKVWKCIMPLSIFSKQESHIDHCNKIIVTTGLCISVIFHSSALVNSYNLSAIILIIELSVLFHLNDNISSCSGPELLDSIGFGSPLFSLYWPASLLWYIPHENLKRVVSTFLLFARKLPVKFMWKCGKWKLSVLIYELAINY